MEEAGIRVKNIQYYKSQPWGVVDDLLAGFYCEVDGDTEIHMDASELKLAEWKSRATVSSKVSPISVNPAINAKGVNPLRYFVSRICWLVFIVR